MKIRSVSLAAALACVASSSFALTPAQIDATTVQLWISGATAPTAAVYNTIKKLCVDADTSGAPDDLHTYLELNPTGAADMSPGKSLAGKYAAYACTMGPNAGALDGVKTVVYHTFDVGSFEAYTPHLWLAGVTTNPSVTSSVKRLKDITAAGSTCAATGVVANTYLNCGNVSVVVEPNLDVNGVPTVFEVPTLPVGGISDTEYVLNKLNLGITKDLADIGTEVSSNVGQGFGVAASYPLYVEMQKQQGIIATTAVDGETCDATGVFPVGLTAVNGTVVCQPNISRQKYASLVGATVADKNASLLIGGTLTAATGALTVERRVGTSGTQSVSNAFFLNVPCATGLPAGAGSVAGSNVAASVSFPGGVTVRSNAGSSNVKANITAASTAGTRALGVLSLENSPSSTEKFNFLKLNGVSPTADANQRQTAINGDYEMWYELVSFTASTATAEGVELMTTMNTAMADPGITNLKGLFVTPLSGFVGATVSTGFKAGNACSVAAQ